MTTRSPISEAAKPKSARSVPAAEPSANAGSPKGFGLDEVVAADTALSDVDGARGRLVLRGHPLEELAGSASFEATLGLLWEGRLPDAAAERRLRSALGAKRLEAHQELARLGSALKLEEPMAALRAAVATLTNTDDERETALRLTGSIAVFAGAWHRLRSGQPAVVPEPTLSHAADLLRLVGADGTPALAAALDAYLVTVADHGLNASTFAARVVASTASDTVSAVTAAIGALKGKLHGGAPGPVLDLLDRIGSAENAERTLSQLLASGERIMGMGHRVYRTRDPRAEVLERATLGLGPGPHAARVALARSVERTATELLATKYPDRKLCANVEFFTAVLLEAVGIPRELFSAVFAAGRVAGWCAHIAEQRATGRIVRPSSRYVGPPTAVTPLAL
jgi:citrate synthase